MPELSPLPPTPVATPVIPSTPVISSVVERSLSPRHFPWWIPLTLALLVFAAVASYLFYQNNLLRTQLAAQPTSTPSSTPAPSSDPTSTWKTYTSNSQFTFMYPHTLTKKEFSKTELLLSANDESHEFRINIFTKPPKKSIQTFVYNGGIGENYGKVYQDLDANYKITFNLISEKDGVKIWQPSDNFPSGRGIYSRFIEHADKLIWFSLEPYNVSGTVIPNQEEFVNLFNQIFSTFKFTDQTTSTSTYTCPPTGYVDCMPALDAAKQKACSSDAMN